MCFRIWAAGSEKTLYALEYSSLGATIKEDTQTGFLAAIERLFWQLIGQKDYRFHSIATHIAQTLDVPFRTHESGRVDRRFQVQLPENVITIFGRFTKIDRETWQKISHIGKQLLQITNDNWFQTNDISFSQTHEVQQANLAMFNRLTRDQILRAKCERFVKMCPSLQYRVFVRLALKCCHESSGSDGSIFA